MGCIVFSGCVLNTWREAWFGFKCGEGVVDEGRGGRTWGDMMGRGGRGEGEFLHIDRP